MNRPNDVRKLLQISSIALVLAFLVLILLVFSPIIGPLRRLFWDVGSAQIQTQKHLLDWLSRGDPANGYIVYFGFWVSLVVLIIIILLTGLIWFFVPPPDMNNQEKKQYEMALSASVRGNVTAVMLAVQIIAMFCIASILLNHRFLGLDSLIKAIFGG